MITTPEKRRNARILAQMGSISTSLIQVILLIEKIIFYAQNRLIITFCIEIRKNDCFMRKPSLTGTACPAPGDIKCFLIGSYCPHCGKFDEELFLENWRPPVFIAHTFICRRLKTLHHHFQGDLIMGLIMCEIWQYNFGRYLAQAPSLDRHLDLDDPEQRAKVLPACNAYSVSQALGVPSETVRRKVKKLIDLGWVQRNGKGELRATLEGEGRFHPEHHLEFMREFVSVARHTLHLLEKKSGPV